VNLPADDPQAQVRNAALLQGLQELGWTVGRNVRIDFRWGAGNAERIRRDAAELVALAPDVLLAPGTSTLEPLLQATRVVPIVFFHVADPVGGETRGRRGRLRCGGASPRLRGSCGCPRSRAGKASRLVALVSRRALIPGQSRDAASRILTSGAGEGCPSPHEQRWRLVLGFHEINRAVA
jgi:ABC transporter substrate binding protein